MSAPGSEPTSVRSAPRLRLAALVLAHEEPELVARLVRRLAESCEIIVLHWDAKADAAALDAALAALPESARARLLHAPRVAVGWAGWSMVEATLGLIETLLDSGRPFDVAMLLSGSDYPIRSAAELHAFLAAHRGLEFIEAVDPSAKRWMVGGLNEERFRYHHLLDWRKRPLLHDALWRLQKLLGLRRRMPRGLQPAFGSQWWALTEPTLRFVRERARDKGLRRFFRTVWIPDEMFVQTLVRNSPAASRIANRHLTHVQFTQRGRPVTLHTDHVDYLRSLPFFFARKLAPEATELRDALDRAQVEPDPRAVERAPELLRGSPPADYPIFVELFGQGVAGRRLIGRVRDPWYGDLEWNERPYLVLVGADDRLLAQAARALARRPGWVAFGSLFDPARIDYGPGPLRVAGHGEYDVALRDHAPQTFLVQLLQAAPPGNVVFTMNLRHRGRMTDVTLWDRHASIALVEHRSGPIAPVEEGPRPTHGLLHAYADRFGIGILEGYRAEMRRVAEARNLPLVELPLPGWLVGGPGALAGGPADPPLDPGRRLVVFRPMLRRGEGEVPVPQVDWLESWQDREARPERVEPVPPPRAARAGRLREIGED